MNVRCLYNSGKELKRAAPQSFFYTEASVFHLQIGQEYPAFGLGIRDSVLLALILDDTGKPNWLPVGLFEFNEEPIPLGWKFSVRDGMAASSGKKIDGWVAMWGYPTLVEEPSHSDRLVERDPKALAIFFQEASKHPSSGPETR